MSVISNRAAVRRTAVLDELRDKYPTLLKARVRPDRTAIALGRNLTGTAVLVPQRAFLEHCHAIGTTGSGKTTLMAHACRQAIATGCGAVVIDPHGGLYQWLLAWADRGGYLARRKVHLIEPNAAAHTIGFNPLARPDGDTDLSVIAGVVLEAFSRAWGDEDTATKPTIERVLTAVFSALADLNLTLVEAPMLLDRQDRHGLRAHAIEAVSDRYTRDELQRLHELSLDERRRHDFDLEVVGPINRLARFIRPPAIRAMIGQTEHTLDLRKAMDEGHVILCNLSGGARVYETDADLLGRLLTRSLFFHAKRRRHPERPFFMVLDECQRYLSGDLENILAEVRKYGVAAFLGHQWLEQLRTQGDNMLAAVQNATNVKLVFRIKDAKEAEQLAASVVPLDLEIPVQKLIKPSVIGHRRIRLANDSTSEQSATTHSVAETHGESESHTVSYSETVGTTEGESESISESEGFSSSEEISHASASGSAASANSTDMLTPAQGFFDSPALVGMSQGVGSSTSTLQSSGSTHGSGRSSGTARTTGMSRAVTNSSSWGESISRATSRATSIGRSESRGTGQTHGSAEGLEPILAALPSAVHSKDAVLYMAAEKLRSLKTGQAFLHFVGANGMESGLINVARVAEHRLSAKAFAVLRERVLSQSSATLTMAEAIAAIAKRETLLLERKSASDETEPASFRTKAPAAAAMPARTPLNATGRDRSRLSSKRKLSGR